MGGGGKGFVEVRMAQVIGVHDEPVMGLEQAVRDFAAIARILAQTVEINACYGGARRQQEGQIFEQQLVAE